MLYLCLSSCQDHATTEHKPFQKYKPALTATKLWETNWCTRVQHDIAYKTNISSQELPREGRKPKEKEKSSFDLERWDVNVNVSLALSMNVEHM